MFGKKKSSEPCQACDRPIREGQKVCACGSATRYMDFFERTEYEVQRWRAYQARAAS